MCLRRSFMLLLLLLYSYSSAVLLWVIDVGSSGLGDCNEGFHFLQVISPPLPPLATTTSSYKNSMCVLAYLVRTLAHISTQDMSSFTSYFLPLLHSSNPVLSLYYSPSSLLLFFPFPHCVAKWWQGREQQLHFTVISTLVAVIAAFFPLKSHIRMDTIPFPFKSTE